MSSFSSVKTYLPRVKNCQEIRKRKDGQYCSGWRGTKWLMVSLLYDVHLRVMACLGLRVKDIDFS